MRVEGDKIAKALAKLNMNKRNVMEWSRERWNDKTKMNMKWNEVEECYEKTGLGGKGKLQQQKLQKMLCY
jgi:hypothetical protein